MPKTVSVVDLAKSGHKVTDAEGRSVAPVMPKPAVDMAPLVTAIEKLVAEASDDHNKQVALIGQMVTKFTAPAVVEAPQRWDFTFIRNKEGLLEKIVAVRVD